MTDLDPAHRQLTSRVRFDWGPTGAAAITDGPGGADIAVVVDVLSFTTTLTVALERGITVLPYRWHDAGAAAYAAEHDAVLAVGRLEQRSGAAGVSLSPAAMAAVTGVDRIVLPSPNGSSIAFALRDSGAVVVGACLRNAPAVGTWLAARLDAGATVAVVAAGERWPDGSLRPAVEDLWGAGAVLAGLAKEASDSQYSPEARSAVASYLEVAGGGLGERMRACASGAELEARGFGDDVDLASEAGATDVVPVLRGQSFSAH